MRANTKVTIFLAVSAAMILSAGIALRSFAAPQQASKPSEPIGAGTATADFPRGAEQIYMIKCWMCHNELAKTGPPLKDISKRPKLISGPPVNDKSVSEVIRNGSQRMPSYRYSLSEQQLADLVSYLLNGKCCPDPENPPVNPQYRKPS
jgi:mono/diheme cytochrome c family protein